MQEQETGQEVAGDRGDLLQIRKVHGSLKKNEGSKDKCHHDKKEDVEKLIFLHRNLQTTKF